MGGYQRYNLGCSAGKPLSSNGPRASHESTLPHCQNFPYKCSREQTEAFPRACCWLSRHHMSQPHVLPLLMVLLLLANPSARTFKPRGVPLGALYMCIPRPPRPAPPYHRCSGRSSGATIATHTATPKPAVHPATPPARPQLAGFWPSSPRALLLSSPPSSHARTVSTTTWRGNNATMSALTPVDTSRRPLPMRDVKLTSQP